MCIAVLGALVLGGWGGRGAVQGATMCLCGCSRHCGVCVAVETAMMYVWLCRALCVCVDVEGAMMCVWLLRGL